MCPGISKFTEFQWLAEIPKRLPQLRDLRLWILHVRLVTWPKIDEKRATGESGKAVFVLAGLVGTPKAVISKRLLLETSQHLTPKLPSSDGENIFTISGKQCEASQVGRLPRRWHLSRFAAEGEHQRPTCT